MSSNEAISHSIGSAHAPPTSLSSWLCTRVEEERLAFEQNTYTPPPRSLIDRFNKLLQDDEVVSSGRSSVRRRARHVAAEIYQKIGPDVLLLVVIVVKSIDKLKDLERESPLIDQLQLWWSQKAHPPSLSIFRNLLVLQKREVPQISHYQRVVLEFGMRATYIDPPQPDIS
ncbi:hypothetical protein IQ07DRAFT_188928 [Pyrenochaeta sp. DS3sAY3a]|nr:hypothetical protein IQ07DRAFT_188928 [Pyrenochaeta sp. DS3sAY3a]